MGSVLNAKLRGQPWLEGFLKGVLRGICVGFNSVFFYTIISLPLTNFAPFHVKTQSSWGDWFETLLWNWNAALTGSESRKHTPLWEFRDKKQITSGGVWIAKFSSLQLSVIRHCFWKVTAERLYNTVLKVGKNDNLSWFKWQIVNYEIKESYWLLNAMIIKFNF